VSWTAPYPGFVNAGIRGRPVASGGGIAGTGSALGGLYADNSAVTAGGSGDNLVTYQDLNLIAPVTLDQWGSFLGQLDFSTAGREMSAVFMWKWIIM